MESCLPVKLEEFDLESDLQKQFDYDCYNNIYTANLFYSDLYKKKFNRGPFFEETVVNEIKPTNSSPRNRGPFFEEIVVNKKKPTNSSPRSYIKRSRKLYKFKQEKKKKQIICCIEGCKRENISQRTTNSFKTPFYVKKSFQKRGDKNTCDNCYFRDLYIYKRKKNYIKKK